MPPIDPSSVGLPLALTLGLIFGMGPCLISCMPYLSPIFLGTDVGVRRSWTVLLPLSAGRLTVYGGFGAAAGWLGAAAVAEVHAGTIRLVLGCAALMVGAAMLLRRRVACAGTPASIALRRMDRAERRTLMPGGVYLLGVSIALSPCGPLSLVLLAAALSAQPLYGAALGLAFGCGAIAVPSLAYGLGLAYFGERLRRRLGAWRPRLELLAAALMIAAGAGNLIHLNWQTT
jgi:thiol:disulfide interchange protein DsbD